MTELSVEVFSHKADSYHTYRIAPPPILVDIAQSILNDHPPTTVVDLGCGTGLSGLEVKKYCDVATIITNAMKAYCTDVREGKFPEESHCYHMKDGEKEKQKLNQIGELIYYL